MSKENNINFVPFKRENSLQDMNGLLEGEGTQLKFKRRVNNGCSTTLNQTKV